MEPVGVVGFALAASSIIAAIFQTTSAANGSHEEIHTMAMALEAEMARVRRWRGYHETLDAGVRTEDEEAAQRTEVMVMRELEELYAMFDRFRTPKKAKTSRRIQNSLKWVTTRRKVANTLHLCKQLNDVIDSLRQPTREIAILQRQIEHLMDGQKDILRSIAEAREESLRFSQQLRNPPPGFDPGLEESVSKIDEYNAAFVKRLYELALQGLLIVEKLSGSQVVTHLYERLKIWGTGLFDGPLGLVSILTAYPDYTGGSDRGASCGVFQSAFIDILLDIEHIQLLLRTENAAVLAFQNDLADFLEADSPIKEEIFYRTLLRSPVNKKMPDEDINECLSHIEDEVENLFVALRAVDSLRDLHWYRLQRQPDGQIFASEKPANPVPVTEQRLRRINETIVLGEGLASALRRSDANGKGGGRDLAEEFERIVRTREMERD